MPELDDRDAMKLMVHFYHDKKHFPIENTVNLVNILLKADVGELVKYAFDQGVSDTEAER